MDPTLLLTYIAACFVFSLVPGPSVTLVLANSLAHGTKAGLWTIFGTEVSMLTMVLIVAVGLDAVVELVGAAFFWIKLAGAAYLIWIGWQMFSSRGGLKLEGTAGSGRISTFIWQGALVNWGNPKTLLFLGAFIPQFVTLSEPAFPQILVLGLIVMAVATFTDAIYAILAGSARNALTASRVRILSKISGSVLMAGGVWLALLRR